MTKVILKIYTLELQSFILDARFHVKSPKTVDNKMYCKVQKSRRSFVILSTWCLLLSLTFQPNTRSHCPRSLHIHVPKLEINIWSVNARWLEIFCRSVAAILYLAAENASKRRRATFFPSSFVSFCRFIYFFFMNPNRYVPFPRNVQLVFGNYADRLQCLDCELLWKRVFVGQWYW